MLNMLSCSEQYNCKKNRNKLTSKTTNKTNTNKYTHTQTKQKMHHEHLT